MRDEYQVDEHGQPLEQEPQAPPPYYAPPQAYPPEYYAQPPQYGPPHGYGPQPQYPPPPQPPPVPPEAEEEREERGSRVGHWVGWVLACAVIGVAIGAAIVGVLKFVNGPVTARAIPDPLEAARESAAPTPSTNVVQGKQIYFKYPSSFDALGDQHSENGLDTFMIGSKNSSQRTIAASVVPLSSGDIEDDSGYKYRSIHPELYSSKEIRLGGERAVIFTKQDKTETTLFWPHKGKDLNMAITATDPKTNVSDILNQIIPTIRWEI